MIDETLEMIPSYRLLESPICQIRAADAVAGQLNAHVNDQWDDEDGDPPDMDGLGAQMVLDILRALGVRFEHDGGDPEDSDGYHRLRFGRAPGGSGLARVLFQRAYGFAAGAFPDNKTKPVRDMVLQCLGFEHLVLVPDDTHSVARAIVLLRESYYSEAVDVAVADDKEEEEENARSENAT